jgi:hypothetical protein
VFQRPELLCTYYGLAMLEVLANPAKTLTKRVPDLNALNPFQENGLCTDAGEPRGTFLLVTESPSATMADMSATAPRRQPDPPPSEHASSEHHRTPQIYTLEATGLLVIAGLILILTLVRYWHHIAWSAR